ncbi:retrovirus-related pol polyprotein from transposon TNT 1-94 [Tanacetum coccineum]|uniref:Retrovirus-related pol polyprotein from transposon TNT 1-94 n=1 Tax=Tanacetum coccineum TaxID=301880 RepID=A0ABQ4Y8A3_9ASTR
MEISIADQIALDDALVAPADRLKIGKCNLYLSSDVTSKEATLQVVYDVLKLTPFYKAFQVTADAPEIYMQEFWASAYVHNRSVRFKMNNKKHIIGLDQFRDILQICPKVGNKKFVEPPLEKEILIFLASLGHSGDIRKITDVNVNKLHQPWRSFAAIINKCLSGKPSYDSLRLSQAQILWGMYNKKNVDYAYLLWEDFIFKIENKNTKKGNAMYYPRFTKLVVNFVMEKDPSIPRRNKVNWHYARDDPMFTTINVISRNEAISRIDGYLLVVYEMVRSIVGHEVASAQEVQSDMLAVVQIVLWNLDSGCSKHMTGDHSQLTKFVNKFLGTVKFRNDHIANILGYGDYQIGNVTISRVYYVEGLGHNLFSVGQFCDSNLKVAFRQHTCFIRNLEGVDLLIGSRGKNLYSLSLGDMMASSPICLLSKASKTKSWLWHRRLSHLNFGTINRLARHGLVRGLPMLKFEKDHLCSTCVIGVVDNSKTVMDSRDAMPTTQATYKSLKRTLVFISHRNTYAFHLLSHSELVDIEKVSDCSPPASDH